MPKPLLSLLLMVKNEARSIERVIESVCPAVDCVDMLDTGSTDETISLARSACERLGLPFRLYQEPFLGYASSRNRLLTLASPYAVFGIQISGDEISEGPEALRAFCEKRKNATGIGSNLYMVRVDVGSGVGTLYATRLVRLGSPWMWKGAIHEYMVNEINPEDRPTELLKGSLFTIHHRETDPARKRARIYSDLKVLQEELEANPDDTRATFYLAQTLSSLGLFEDAIRCYVKRAGMGDWEEERYMSMYRAGLCAWHVKRPWIEIQDYLITATVMRPSRAEALVRLAEFCWERKDFQRAFFYAHRASMIPFPETDCFGVEPEAYLYRALNIVHLCGLFLGEVDIGMRATELLLERVPEDRVAFENNLKRYQELKQLRAQSEAARVERTPLISLG